MRNFKRSWRARVAFLLALAASAGPAVAAWNNPYPTNEAHANILYTSFQERPKHLDPARSYSENEYVFLAQVYEPPFQYHYLKRPYELIPLTAAALPKPQYFDSNGRRLAASAAPERIAFSVYEIRLRPGIYYQPHPAFAKDEHDNYRYHALTERDLDGVYTIADFKHTGTRELTAADYIYQIKRLAHPALHSPVLSVMAEYIHGIKAYTGALKKSHAAQGGGFFDLRQYPLAGVEEVDRYTYRVKIHGTYPQLLYWMAMPFFAPMPWEADKFFSQPGMNERNLTLDWYPVGTGAYMLTVNNPNRQMVLERNPNYHNEFYPTEGEPEDAVNGLLRDAGKRLPFVDKIVFSLEKESIPYWNKFLQGYYDRSGVLSESFDQAVSFTGSGDMDVTEAMREKGIRLRTSVATSTFYHGFNMLDPVVGGYTERARKLRQAISIAIDYEEQISIFLNGRGLPAQGPIPPGIFGYEEGKSGINPYVYDWVNGAPKRKSIDAARRLLADAGYPNGVDQKTGKPLTIYYETAATGPQEKSRLDWLRKQFSNLNIQLVVRATDYNRFQEKMRKGDAQLFVWGWNADYPDPENFLFLLYGPNKKVGTGGENASNYDNPEFNRLFERMKHMPNGPERLTIIRQMVDIARRDAPWSWGINPKQFVLEHAWMANTKPNQIANNTYKYLRIDPARRAESREAWNRPVLWPIAALLGVLLVSALPAVVAYRRREVAPPRAAGHGPEEHR
jgi:oligopeptide transport system substrate-binding protein